MKAIVYSIISLGIILFSCTPENNSNSGNGSDIKADPSAFKIELAEMTSLNETSAGFRGTSVTSHLPAQAKLYYTEGVLPAEQIKNTGKSKVIDVSDSFNVALDGLTPCTKYSAVAFMDVTYEGKTYTRQSDVLEFVTKFPSSEPSCQTASQFMSQMKAGWNLGLALSFYSTEIGMISAGTEYETWWVGTKTTQEMIDAVAAKGFNAIRIQVSYMNHMDAEGNINLSWLKRVSEVVDYCMKAGVYCILDTTGAGWMVASKDKVGKLGKIYGNLWTQIAARFRDYPDLLLFESCNEVLDENSNWNSPANGAYEAMKEYYSIFIDAVRSSGGMNRTRNLILNTYAAGYTKEILGKFDIPSDWTENHLIGEVHCYAPTQFCFNETNLGSTDFRNEWGGTNDESEIDEIMATVAKYSKTKGIPFIIGEFGTVKRVSEDQRANYIAYYTKQAAANGIKVVLFDDGYDFAVFDRKNLTWPYEKIINAVFDNVK